MTDDIQVKITSLGARGDGIGEYDGLPVYVPGALPGEQVLARVIEAKRGGLYTRLLSVEDQSNQRQSPACQHFGACGGCQLQHLDGQTYESWVRDRAGLALRQHGFEDVLIETPFIALPASRRRVSLKALKTIKGVIIGLNEAGTHQIVDILECPVLNMAIASQLPSLRTVLNQILPQKALAKIHLTEASNGLDLLIDVALPLDLAAREKLVDFADACDIAALHWQSEGYLDPVAIRREPVMDFGGIRVPLPPAVFVQACASAETVLTDSILRACQGYGRVADLFCGIGTFTFPLAKTHQVLAVEGSKEAIAALDHARNMNQSRLKQIVTRHRDIFRRPLGVHELKGFDVVVIDPPRAGAQAQMLELAGSDVKRVVSVSCNPNTFARDARILADGGYELKSVLPVDQFLWSQHLELVGIFSRA